MITFPFHLYSRSWNQLHSSDIFLKKNFCDLNLGEFLCPDSGPYLLKGFDFYFDLFWMAWHWKPAIALAGVVSDATISFIGCDMWYVRFEATSWYCGVERLEKMWTPPSRRSNTVEALNKTDLNCWKEIVHCTSVDGSSFWLVATWWNSWLLKNYLQSSDI